MSARRCAWLACALCAACAGGSETGNPGRPTEIALSAHSTDPHAVALASGSGDARIDEAWVSFGEFKFFTAGTCASIGAGNVHGQPVVAADLVAPGAKVEVDLAPGKYCGVVVPIEQPTTHLPRGAPAALADHSIVVRGELADGTPFVIEHPEQDELELSAPSGSFTAAPGGADLLLSFDVVVWLTGVDIASGTRESDGSVRIDKTHNTALLTIFELNVECSLQLYRDDDGNGRKSTGDQLLAMCAND